MSDPAYDITVWGAARVARAKDSRNWPQNRQKHETGTAIWRLEETSTTHETGLCNYCSTINFEAILDGEIKLEDNRDEIPLGYLEDINLNGGTCAFCRLVVKTVCLHTGTTEPVIMHNGERVKCDLRTVSSGIDGGKDLWLVTIPVLEPYPKIPTNIASSESGRVRVRPLNTPVPWTMRQTAFRGQMIIHAISDEYTGTPYGRRVDERVSLPRLKYWVENSPRLFAGYTAQKIEFKESGLGLPPNFTLIDVRSQCLTRGPLDAEYVALSYVWGNLARPFLRTLVSNKARLDTPGGLSPADPLLPRTIRDSILLVKALGLQYLWVDSLCIVQDDYGTKEEQLDAMGIIYSQAKFTIVAAAGNDADAGLPGVGLSARSSHQHISPVQHSQLANRLPSGLNAIDSAWWNTRAWTFQERIFSQALLIFTSHQASYRYGRFEFCEDIWPNEQVDISEPDSHVLPIDFQNMGRYAMSVVNYCSRSLTFQQDGLAAFAAIATSLRSAFRSDFMFGLPDTALDHALLWIPRGPSKRREFTENGESYFPTWSWAGWIGTVGYDSPRPLSSRVLWRDFNAAEDQFSPPSFFRTKDTIPTSQWEGWKNWAKIEGSKSNRWRDLSETPMREYLFPTPLVKDRKPVLRANRKTGYLQFWTHVARFSLADSDKLLPDLLYGGQLKGEDVIRRILTDDNDTEVGEAYLNCAVPLLSTEMNSANENQTVTAVLLSRSCMTHTESDLIAGHVGAYQAAIGEYGVVPEGMGDGRPWDQAQFECDRNDVRDGKGWGRYNVMLVWQREGVAERIGIGWVGVDAFHDADPARELITLR